MAVHPARAGSRGGVPDANLQGKPDRLHVRQEFAQRPLHHPVQPRQCGGPGPDEQLLPGAGFASQLQRLQLRLLRLRCEQREAFREEPVRRYRRRLARPADSLRHQPRKHPVVRPEHRHRAHCGSGLPLRGRSRHPALPAHVWHAGGLPQHATYLVLRCLSKYRQGSEGDVTSIGHSRHGGRGHRLLPRAGHLRAVPAGSGAAVGGRRRPQRRRTVRTIPGAAQAVCHRGAGELTSGLRRRQGGHRQRHRSRHRAVRWRGGGQSGSLPDGEAAVMVQPATEVPSRRRHLRLLYPRR